MSPTLLPDGTPASKTSKTLDHLDYCLKRILSLVDKPGLGSSLACPDFDPETFARMKPTQLPSDEIYKNALEAAFKGILYEMAAGDTVVNNSTLPAFCNLLDLSLVFAELEFADPGLTLNLIEELFDSHTIPSCEHLFQYLESRIERITAGVEGGKGKGLVLLRLCNELLRRLSKTEDTIFCGRILIFLSKSFPIGERSGVNLRGDFNVENVTAYDETPRAPAAPSFAMDVDTKDESSEGTDAKGGDNTKGSGAASTAVGHGSAPKKEPEILDASELYRIFWPLQHDFADPQRLFVPENLQKFKVGLAATMAKFQHADEEAMKTAGGLGKPDSTNAKKVEERKPGAVLGEKRKRNECDDDEAKGEGFNAKYLTSRELFELEICDLTFRRHVLVQAMILIDFLLGLTPKAKEKWKDLVTPNRAVQYAFTLGPEDELWALKTKAQISTSLSPDQPGRLFMRLINTILTREQNWVRWKAESCHPFDMPPLAESDFEDAKQKAIKQCMTEPPFRHIMGTPTLSRLWKDTGDSTGLQGLGIGDRYHLPSPESFRQGVIQAEEDLKDAMLPTDIEEAQNSKFTKTWKALRLASQDRLYLFNKFDDKLDENRNDLEMFFEVEEKEAKAKVIQAVTVKIMEKASEANRLFMSGVEKLATAPVTVATTAAPVTTTTTTVSPIPTVTAATIAAT